MPVATITPAEVDRLKISGRRVNILDVRTPGEFARVHAAGAQSIPLDELDADAVAAQYSALQEPVFVICQSGGRSAKACEQLQNAGCKSAYSVEGGTVAWERMGLAVERGQGGAISMERQVRIGAGAIVCVGAALAWWVHPYFLAIPASIGAGLVFAGVTDYCGMAKVLAKMPWNR